MLSYKAILSTLLIGFCSHVEGSLLPPSVVPFQIAHPINAPPHVWESRYHNTLIPNPVFNPFHAHVTPIGPIAPVAPIAPIAPVLPTAPLAPLPAFPELVPWLPPVVRPPTLAFPPSFKEHHHHHVSIGFATPVLKPTIELHPLFKSHAPWPLPAAPPVKHVHPHGHFVKAFPAPAPASLTGWSPFPEIIG